MAKVHTRARILSCLPYVTLSLTLCLAACGSPGQTPVSLPPSSEQQSISVPPTQTTSFLNKVNALGQGQITPDPKHPGKARVSLKLQLQKPQQPKGFETQAVAVNSLSKVRGEISGIGIGWDTPILLDGADEYGFVPINNQEVEVTFSNVPYGKVRNLWLYFWNDVSSSAETEGVGIGTAFELKESTTSVEISYRTTPLFHILYGRYDEIYTRLNLVELQAFLDEMMGLNGSFPNYNYTKTHPLLIKCQLIGDVLGNDELSTLDPDNPQFLANTSSVSGTVSGLVSTDTVHLRVNDAVSPNLLGQVNGEYTLTPVLHPALNHAPSNAYSPTPFLHILAEGGTSYSIEEGNLWYVPFSIQAQEAYDGAHFTHNIVLTPAQPSITSISPGSSLPGQTVTITGENFHANADGNVVKFGDTVVSPLEITVISSGELQVKVPPGETGFLPVTVSVGTQNSNNVSSQFFRTMSSGYVNPLGMQFNTLPSGSFTMGGVEADETPQHTVNISSFQMMATEVTQKQWWDVMGTWDYPYLGSPPEPSYGQGDHYPIYNVGLCQIIGQEGDPEACDGVDDSFLKRLNAQGHGIYRLPTEAEWEYAARAGSTTDYACPADAFPSEIYGENYGDTSNCLNEMGWYSGNNSPNGAKSVASKQPNAWGLFDMHGNVAEMVADWYEPDYYQEAVGGAYPRNNPQGPPMPEYFTDRKTVFRGGSWSNNAEALRLAKRLPDPVYGTTGFRLVREIPATPVLSSLSPDVGLIGDMITLTGSHFSAYTSANKVKFGEIEVPVADITYISSNQLQVKVPSGFSGTVPVTVSVGGMVSENQMFRLSQGEFQVNSTDSSLDPQERATVGMNANGDYVISWHVKNERGIYARRFLADGRPQGEAFQVNAISSDQQHDPAVAIDSNGNFVITWMKSSGANPGIYTRLYLADGNPQGAEFRVDTVTGTGQYPAMAIDGDGRFVISWHSGSDVYAKLYAMDGNVLKDQFKVNTSGSGHSSVAMSADGHFVVSWAGIRAQRFTPDGNPQGSEIQVKTMTEGFPTIAMNNDSFVITWEAASPGDGSSYGIFAKRYALDGSLLNDEFLVNSYTSGEQGRPAIAMGSNGDFVISWRGKGEEDEEGIHAQRYGSNGTFVDPLLPEFQPNTYTTGAQSYPAVAMDANGNFVISWESQAVSKSGILGQRYNYQGIPQ